MLSSRDLLFQDENLNRCSISADSRIENSGTEDSTDDENLDMKENGYHDAQNEVDPETDDDAERVHSGKLSESSGYAGSDLYDYKVLSLSLSLSIRVYVCTTTQMHRCLIMFMYMDMFVCVYVFLFTDRHLLAKICFDLRSCCPASSSIVLHLLLQV
jgi:hypothetical protein